MLKRRCKLLSFLTIIFAVFLHDLAYTYQIASNREHSRQSYDIISIFQQNSHRVGNLPPGSVLVITLHLGHVTPSRPSLT